MRPFHHYHSMSLLSEGRYKSGEALKITAYHGTPHYSRVMSEGFDPDKLDTPQCWVNRCSVRTGLLLCILGDVAVFYLAVKLF